MNDVIKKNKELWDEWAKFHFDSGSDSTLYNVKKFKSGLTSLTPVELQELGSVKNKSLLHLQCHFGLDTLSWAREGAEVTGMDLSSEAIKLAKQLSLENNIPAEFICSDIYELPTVLNKKYDIVFTSYGVLNWLKNLDEWANIVAHYLKPGGTFYIVEFHPFVHMFEHTEWKKIEHPYATKNTRDPVCCDLNGTYIDPKANFSHTSYRWFHTLSEIINSLRQAGLIIDFLHEFDYLSHNSFPSLEEKTKGQFTPKNMKNSIPLMFSIKARFFPQLLSK